MNKQSINILTISYIAIRSVLFCLLHFAKLTFDFPFICLDFAFAFLFILQKKRNFVGFLALFFTMIADLYLVHFHDHQVLGTSAFCLAQLCYGYYIYLCFPNKKEGLISLISRLGLFLVLFLISAIVTKSFHTLVIVTMFYFSNLLVNIVFTCLHFKKKPLLAIGFIFFLMCDLFVGLYTGSEMGMINLPGFVNFVNNGYLDFSWVFYMISQALITLSITTCDKIEKEE